jgi:integrase/recombinase XerD
MPLNYYRNHSRKCTNADKSWKNYDGCDCVFKVEGNTGAGRKVKQSLETRDKIEAERRTRYLEVEDIVIEVMESKGLQNIQTASNGNGVSATATIPPHLTQAPQAPPPSTPYGVTIEYSVTRFMANRKALNNDDETIKKFRQLTDALKKWCERKRIGGKPITHVRQLDDVDLISEFRESWTTWAPRTAKPMFERLRQFFKFCVARRWMDRNPAKEMDNVSVDDRPTMPYTAEAIEKMLWACEIYSTHGKYRSNNRKRMRAMVLLQRYSGLAMMDAATLERSRLGDDSRLLLYREKTGEPVYVRLPQWVADELRALDSPNPKYFFWSGKGRKESTVKVWDESYTTLLRIAGIKKTPGNNMTSHRMRDTFAVEFLQSKDKDGNPNPGATLENLKMLLGHKSIKTTEKHYAPWVNTRQAALDKAVEIAWS